MIYVIVGVCLALGILYGLIAPVEYESEAMVLPEMKSNNSQFGDLLQNYGGLMGLGSTGSLNSSEQGTIPPQVYPKILQSLTFQHEMLSDTVYFADEQQSMTLFQYFKDKDTPFYKQWLGQNDSDDRGELPQVIQQEFDTTGISSVTPGELKVINILRQRLSIEFDSNTGVMKVSATMPDAVAAAQVCTKAINRLTNYLKEYRTQKAKNVLNFAEEQYEIGRDRFKAAQDALANYKDKNLNLNTEAAQSREDYLQAEYDLAYNVYNSVAQKQIQARMRLEENTPVFKTLQPANVPVEKSRPHRILIIIVSIIIGLIISFLYIGSKYMYQSWVGRIEPNALKVEY